MKRRIVFVVAVTSVTLVFGLSWIAWSSLRLPSASTVSSAYVVTGAASFADIEAIKASGAVVNAVGFGAVEVTATPAEASKIKLLGFTVTPGGAGIAGPSSASSGSPSGSPSASGSPTASPSASPTPTPVETCEASWWIE